MLSEPQGEQRPSFFEIYAGKDVALGKEIVDRLRDEGLGLSILRPEQSESKRSFMIDRVPGEADFSVREKTERPITVLGIVLPSLIEGEFVYFGIEEVGRVFKVTDEHLKGKLDSDIKQEFFIGPDRFWEMLTSVYGPSAQMVLSEDKDPSRFNEIFRAAVEKARRDKEAQRTRRAESRTDLVRGLFGG